MTTLAFERPARPRRVTAPVVHRPRPVAVPLPVVDERKRALTLVREALDHVQLKTALAHVVPAKYAELRALTAGLDYAGALRTLAVDLAADAVMDLGIVQLHDRAREIRIAIEDGTADRPDLDTLGRHDWQARAFWGGVRRSEALSRLVLTILDARPACAPGHAPAMPSRPDARRYPVAPGVAVTADELVSGVFDYWEYLDDAFDRIAPRITGEVHAWFRAFAARLFTEDLATPARRAASRDYLAELLDNGDRYTVPEQPGVSPTMRPMQVDERARLRFVEIHLAAAFGFDAYDARIRHPRNDTAARCPR
jgi:hypothetical protein